MDDELDDRYPFFSLDSTNGQQFVAGIVLVAIQDYLDGYSKPGRPDAATFLRCAGLLQDDGTIRHGRNVYRPSGRKHRDITPGQAERGRGQG